MEYLPTDPAILVSSINMLLRDEEFDTLESICYNFNREPEEIKRYLEENGYTYSEEQKQVRPIGYDQEEEVSKEAIETAYCFFHQKQRVYEYSTMDWQKEDIEYAIGSYIDTMDKRLYEKISSGREEYLRASDRFGSELKEAVEKLEKML